MLRNSACRAWVLVSFAALASTSGQAVQSPGASPPGGPDSTELINADRPGIADGSRVIGAKRLQIEIGLQREDRQAGGIRTLTAFTPLLVRVGVTDHLEARVETNALTSMRTLTAAFPATRTTGWSPVSVGAKYQVYDSDGDNRRSLGVIVRVFPPTGSGDFRSNRTTGDVRLAGDWDFAPHLSLNPNVGLARQEDDQGGAFTATIEALTLTYAPTDRINPFLDVGAQSPEAPGGASSVVVDAGLAFIVGRDLQLDVSAGRGVHGSTSPQSFVALGVSLRSRSKAAPH